MRRLAPLLALLAACGSTEPVVVRDAWIREAPPGASVHAGYLTLENRGASGLAVERISSPSFARIELHEMRMQDGAMQMRKLERLTVPAKGSIRLEPGGTHLMLFGATQPVTAGQRVPLTLRLGEMSVVTEAEVRRKD